MNDTKQDFKSLAVKALAVIGFLAILFFGAWGAVTVVRYLPNALSTLAAAAVSITSLFIPNERIEVTLTPGTATADEPVTLSWEHINKRGEGVYTVSFACRDGVSFDAQAPNGLYTRVFCDTPFNFVNAEKEMKLIPFSEKNRFIDVPLTVAFTKAGESEARASTEAVLTIVNEKLAGSPTTTGTPTAGGTTGGGATTGGTSGTINRLPGTRTQNIYQITPGGQTSDPRGFVDLAVNILGVGVVSTTTNEFSVASIIPRGARGGVRFEVVNLGTKASGGWSFNAPLPTLPFFIFQSVTQPSLNPGDRIEYVIGFDSVDTRTSTGTIVINVDPTSSVKESNENNNLARVTVNIAQ